MHKIYPVLAGLVPLLILAGCGSSDDAPDRAPPPVEETAFGDVVNTMDKARAVEDTTLQHKEELDRRLQESEGQ